MPQHVLIAGTKERREVSDGPEVCLDLAALTFDGRNPQARAATFKYSLTRGAQQNQ
jgi:hypothetical protein